MDGIHYQMFGLIRYSTVDTSKWSIPIHWNQESFDTILIDTSQGLVRFVQIVRNQCNLFKVKYFYAFLKTLNEKAPDFVINDFDAVLVADQGTMEVAKNMEI